MDRVNLSGQSYKQNQDGSWSHIPGDSTILLKAESPHKKDDTLKAQYKDLPRYKLIVEYEDHFRAEFDKMLSETTKEALKFVKESV